MVPSGVTGPPSWTPETHEGRGRWGRSKSTCALPGSVPPPKRERNDDPDDDDSQGEIEVVLEGPGPRGIAAAVGHHHAEDRQHLQQQEGIGGAG